ncbi:MAG: tetratricopeptide repeat protein [Deltaproteobacteria bacterium]|nr:tetratricopeptide repeat protein [Deltaproteobacteria bacterium]
MRLRCALAVVLLLLALVLGVYAQGARFSFVDLDDDAYVTGNAEVLSGLTRDGFVWSWTTFHAANWHPLTWLSHMADVEWFGPDAGPHHLVNAGIHWAGSSALFLALYLMTGCPWRSGVAAMLFAVHPLHVESVAWVSERKDVLSGFFFSLGLLAYGWYSKRPCIRRYMGVVLAYALGLSSKPMLVTFPFVLLILDVWPLGRTGMAAGSMPGAFARPGRGRLWLEKIPLLALSLASCVVTYLAQARGEAVRTIHMYPFDGRVWNAAVSYARYAWKAVWPSNLAVYYPHPASLGKGIPQGEIVAAGIFLLLSTLAAALWFRRRPYLLAGWLWFLGTLVPVIGLVQVGGQAMADRYAYIPLTGLFLAAVWGSWDLLSGIERGRAVYAAAWGAVLLCLSSVSYVQAGYWRDSVALFTRALAVTEENWFVHNNLGNALLERGRAPEAIPHLLTSLRIKPGNAMAHANLGRALRNVGRKSEGEAHCREALRLEPGNVPAKINMAVFLAESGRIDDAILHLRDAIRGFPARWEAFYNLGVLLRATGLEVEAKKMFREAARLRPQDERIRVQLRDLPGGGG